MSIVLRGSLIVKDTPGSGGTDPLLSRNSTTGTVGIEPAGIPSSLLDGYIIVGNGSNIAAAVLPSGKITLTNAGVFGISTGAIVNAEISASAAIALTKLAATTANKALISDGSGFISASAVTNVELGYVSGVTSAIQTQINAKQATITGGATTITSSDLGANFALISSASGKVAVSTISTTKLGYLLNVSSDIQNQFSNKLSFSSALTPSQGDLVYYDGANWVNFPRGTSGQYLTSTVSSIQWVTTPNGVPTGGTAGQYLNKIDGTDFNAQWSTLVLSAVSDVTATVAQVNALATGFYDATTSVQGQLNAKLDKTLNQNYLFVGDASNLAVGLPSGTNGYILTSVSGVPTWVAPTGGGTVTSVAASGGTTGLSFTGTPITGAGTLSLTGTLIPANGGTGLTAIGAANTLAGVNNAGTTLEYKVVSNGLTSTTTSVVLGGTLTVNTTVDTVDKSIIFSGTSAGRTNTISYSYAGGVSIYSNGAPQSIINLYSQNGGSHTQIDMSPTGAVLEGDKWELSGTALTVPTNNSIVSKQYVTTQINSITTEAYKSTTTYVAKTGNYTLTTSDYTVNVTSGTNNQTLPTAVGVSGRMYFITNSGTGVVTVLTTSSQTFANISGTPTSVTLNQFQGITVQSNGANWLKVSGF